MSDNKRHSLAGYNSRSGFAVCTCGQKFSLSGFRSHVAEGKDKKSKAKKVRVQRP